MMVVLNGCMCKMSSEVKAPGTDYTKTRSIIEEGRKRAEFESGQKAASDFIKSLEDDDDDKAPRKEGLTDRQLELMLESFRGVEDFGTEERGEKQVISPPPVSQSQEDPSPDPRPSNQYDFSPQPDPSRGEGSMDAARSYSMNQSSGETFDSRGGRGRFGGNEGGLVGKPKPKAKKKMKRGGLASKK